MGVSYTSNVQTNITNYYVISIHVFLEKKKKQNQTPEESLLWTSYNKPLGSKITSP